MVPDASFGMVWRTLLSLGWAVRDVMRAGFGTGFLDEMKANHNKVYRRVSQGCL